MEYYVPPDDSKALIDQDTSLPPLRLDYPVDIYPHVVPLWREGCLFTPPRHLLHEVWSFVDFMAGSNSTWIDFALYLSKPLLTFGLRFIPDPLVVISHESCAQIINDPLFVKALPGFLDKRSNHPSDWITEALALFKFRIISYTSLPDHQFELFAKGINGNPVSLASSKIQQLFLSRHETSFNQIRYQGCYYDIEILRDSPHYGSTLHFQLLFTVEWILPYLDYANQLNETKYEKSLERFKSLGFMRQTTE
jgi:hypothetical protein